MMPYARTLALLSLTLLTLAGCQAAGWIAQGTANSQKTYDVKAQYRGLENQKVAILVAADEYVLFEHPQAPLAVSRAVGARIAGNVPGVTLVPPHEVVEFQKANPYWTTVPTSQLVEKLGVDRLLVIDLIEYRTHEPGNAHVWQGMITGEVGVVEAESEDPDNFAFSTTVRAQFPEESTIGLLNSDDQTVQLGMLAIFARDAAGLFFDHEVVK